MYIDDNSFTLSPLEAKTSNQFTANVCRNSLSNDPASLSRCCPPPLINHVMSCGSLCVTLLPDVAQRAPAGWVPRSSKFTIIMMTQ